MIVEYVRYRIAKGQEAGFEAAYGAARRALDLSEHCLSYELARCEEEPDRYVLRIEWDGLEGHLQGFRGGPHFRDFLQAVRPYVSAIEEMQHYRVTAVHSGSSLCAALGGVSACFRLAGRMHAIMAEDKHLGSLFRNAAPTHVPHLGMWLCEVFGGPELYSETLGDIAPILSRHAGLDISEEQRARFVTCARRALDEVVGPERDSAKQAAVAYIEWGSQVAVKNSRSGHMPDPSAGVPHWDWEPSA